jgi:heat shock 70kDa protein 1/2/6/8
MATKEIAIGIDLGTTYSCVGIYQHGQVEIITNDQGNRTTPSFVSFTDKERLIGDSAKNLITSNPENTVYDAKRLIGREFNDSEVQDDIRHFSFKVVNDNTKPKIQVTFKDEVKQFTPEEISAMVLIKMKETSEAYLGRKVTKAVVTVPAYFNDAQRRATKDAGTIAGLEVLRIINEPTAAAIAYGFGKEMKTSKNILVVDIGGGTSDYSLLELEEGVFEVKATAGNMHLGGEDYDNRIVDYVVSEYRRKHNVDLKQFPKALRRIKTMSEQAKRSLTSSTQTTIELDAIHDANDLSVILTRARFEGLCSDLFNKVVTPIDKVLSDAKLSKSHVDEIVLVGGSTRIPRIQELIKSYFNGKELCRNINPDEAIAYGASVQGAILTGESDEKLDNMILLDITPLTLGIETQGRFMTPMIKRGTTIPYKHSDTFSTAVDNQQGVTVRIFEGERELTQHNNKLGEFTLNDIAPAPRGVPQIEITYDIDANGMLTVTAKDKTTGKNQTITITNDSNRLSKEDVDRMVEEAERYKEDDAKIKQQAEARNGVENYCYNMKNSLLNDSATRSKLGGDAQIVENVVNETISWLDTHTDENEETYKEKQREIENKLNPIVTKLYSEQPAPSQSHMPNQDDGPSIEEID